MFRSELQSVLTASDVVNHLACRHLTTLDLRNLDEPLVESEDDPTLLLLQKKGDVWERRYLEDLRSAALGLVEIPTKASRQTQLDQTHTAMHSGAPIIFQAALSTPGWFGRADFLRRVPAPSALGDWSYEVLDTKLAREPRASHVLQLCSYSWLLAGQQGREPTSMSVVLGDGSERTFRYADYARYFHRLRAPQRLRRQSPRELVSGSLPEMRPMPLVGSVRSATRGGRPPLADRRNLASADAPVGRQWRDDDDRAGGTRRATGSAAHDARRARKTPHAGTSAGAGEKCRRTVLRASHRRAGQGFPPPAASLGGRSLLRHGRRSAA
jgi:hypothetical protein